MCHVFPEEHPNIPHIDLPFHILSSSWREVTWFFRHALVPATLELAACYSGCLSVLHIAQDSHCPWESMPLPDSWQAFFMEDRMFIRPQKSPSLSVDSKQSVSAWLLEILQHSHPLAEVKRRCVHAWMAVFSSIISFMHLQWQLSFSVKWVNLGSIKVIILY